MRRTSLIALLLFIIVVAWPIAQGARPGAVQRPTLLVVVAVDQMRADYVLKYGSQWTGGLRRLMDHGAWFQQAIYPYAYTVTCVGHATMSTGAFPRTHGIVDNSWWDRASRTVVGCADDATTELVSYGAPVKGSGKSARRLLTPTLADHLRAELPVAPRIVTFSMKERTAIMFAGQVADAVTWFDSGVGAFVTSRAYSAGRVPFIERHLAANPIEATLGTPWVPAAAKGTYLYADAASEEHAPSFWTNVFPHPMRTSRGTLAEAYQAWEQSPASDDYLERLAEASIGALGLGKGPGTDLLGVSFSALDLVGHDFGPQSHEVQDVLFRLDAALGRLLSHLDRVVGPGRYVLALSGDHGVSPIPEQMAAMNIAAGRIPTETFGERAEQVLRPALPPGATGVARVLGGDIYLTPEALDALARDAHLRASLVTEMERIPGMARALLTSERDAWRVDDALANAVRCSYAAGRSPDLILVPRPYYLFGATTDGGASHGTPYRYDAWVPLFFYGSGIRPGRYTQAVTPADLAPTLAWLSGITLPHADGRPLLEATSPGRVPATGRGNGRGSAR